MTSERVRSAVVVAGMHRSGTSAVTHLASLWGMELPHDDIGAQRGNERGHWESRAVIDLNEWLLSQTDSSWFDTVVPATAATSGEVAERFAKALGLGYGAAETLLIKDPRISRLTRTWVEALRDLDIEQSYLLVVRNPLEVAESLQMRDSIPKEQGALLWLVSVLHSEFATRNERRAIVDFEDILTDWFGVLAPIADRIFPRSGNEVLASHGEAIIDRGLKHHTARPGQAIDAELGEWVDRAYRALRELTNDCDSVGALKSLDDLRLEVTAAGPLLRSALPATEGVLRHELTTSNQALVAAEQAATDLRNRAEQLESVVRAQKEVERSWTGLLPQIEDQERRLEAIESSRSWKLMWTLLAPYRRIRHRLERSTQ